MKKRRLELFLFFIVLFVILFASLLTNIDFNKLKGDTSILAGNDKDRIHFINVGSADSILIESQGKFGLVDTGDSTSHVEKYLSQVMGSKKLSFIILTHSHGDHTGGMEDVIENFVNSSTTYYTYAPRDASNSEKMNRFKEMLIQKKAKIVEFDSKKNGDKYDTKVNYYHYNDGELVVDTTSGISRNNITFKNFTIKILNYQHDSQIVACKDTKDDDNRNSLIELITHSSGKRALLTGDMEVDDEYRIVGLNQTASCDFECQNDTDRSSCKAGSVEYRGKDVKDLLSNVNILKLGHHGLYTSSSLEFLDLVNPDTVFVTSGMHDDINDSKLNYGALKHLDDKKKDIYFVARQELNGHDFDKQTASYIGKSAILVTFGSKNYSVTDAVGASISPFKVMTGDTATGADNGKWYKVNYPYKSLTSWIYLEDSSVDRTKKGLKEYTFNGSKRCLGLRQKSGLLIRGWLLYEDRLYYFDNDNNSKKVYGRHTIDGETYTFEGTETCSYDYGYLKQVGFVKVADDKAYYITSSYKIYKETGLKTFNGNKYYFRSDHTLYTGLIKIDGNKYYFYETGDAGSYGKMAKDTNITISGKKYHIDATGVATEYTALVTKPTAANYCDSKTYNGSNQTITSSAPTGVTFSGNSHKDAGTYTVTAKLNSGYLWKDYSDSNVTFKCSISKKSISGVTVTISDQYYTGSALTPSPTVKSGSTTLVKGTDYTISYTNNTNVGTANYTITGMGNYSGSKSGTFKIISKTLELIDTTNMNVKNNKLYIKLKTGISIDKNTLFNNIKNSSTVKLYNSDSEITSGTALAGTTYKLKSGTLEYPIVVYGDVDASGTVNSKDLRIIYINSVNNTLSGLKFEAADYDNSGTINSMDLRNVYIIINRKTE